MAYGYGTYIGNVGGMNNSIAGSPGYFPSDKEVQDRLFNYGMQNTPAGKKIQENIKKFQETLPPGFLRRAEGNPSAPGNFGGMLLAQNLPNEGQAFDVPGGFVPSPGFEGLPPGGMAPMLQGPSQEEIKRANDKAILDQRMQERSSVVGQPINYGRPTPLNLDIDAVEGGLEKIGGSAVIQLDRNQKLRFGGTYLPGYSEQGVPIPQEYRIEGGYSTPTLGVNVNYRPRRQGAPLGGGGLGGNVKFNMPF